MSKHKSRHATNSKRLAYIEKGCTRSKLTFAYNETLSKFSIKAEKKAFWMGLILEQKIFILSEFPILYLHITHTVFVERENTWKIMFERVLSSD